MKAQSMTFDEVYAQLEAWGSEAVRKIYARQGAGENQFGVKFGDLYGLAKKLKTDHPLARKLWATSNPDAMILATMLMDSTLLTQVEIEAMLRPLNYFRLVDELVFDAVAKTAFAEMLHQLDELARRDDRARRMGSANRPAHRRCCRVGLRCASGSDRSRGESRPAL